VAGLFVSTPLNEHTPVAEGTRSHRLKPFVDIIRTKYHSKQPN
jgi:hypothetical protein